MHFFNAQSPFTYKDMVSEHCSSLVKDITPFILQMRKLSFTRIKTVPKLTQVVRGNSGI